MGRVDNELLDVTQGLRLGALVEFSWRHVYTFKTQAQQDAQRAALIEDVDAIMTVSPETDVADAIGQVLRSMQRG